MIRQIIFWVLLVILTKQLTAQTLAVAKLDTVQVAAIDTTIILPDVYNVKFKNPDDEMEYQKDISRIRVVLPYVKIAKRLYENGF